MDRPIDAATARHPVHIILDNIRSAFNVGSIFRTADAGLAAHIHLCGYTCHPPNAKLAKTALGAEHAVPWSRHRGAEDAIEMLSAEGVPVVAIETVHGARPYHTFDWPRPVAIVFGHEVRGVRDEVLARCDEVVCLPMQGVKNTINVATAFGVVLYEILRRWGALPNETSMRHEPGRSE
ncbi:RNA methyltransferase [bacterium]|nr:RNA methyltransferase [bacterium]